MNHESKMFDGSVFCDDRGNLRVINGFNPTQAGVKRFYQVENNVACEIRAWHGHKKEAKYVYCVKGSAIIAVAPMDGWVQEEIETDMGPAFDKTYDYSKIHKFTLSSQKPQILHIPEGNYNGFRTLESGTILQFFSTSTLEESKDDDFRLDWDCFGKEIFEVKPR